MKIALVLPPHSFEDRYNKTIAKAAGTLPPLGILYIAAVLKLNGHRVIVIDGSMVDYKTMINTISNEKPDIVAISTMTFLWKKTKEIIPIIREIVPEAFILVGGPHAIIYKAKCLKESPLLDGVDIGEGEFTLLELINAIERREPLDNIRGLIYKKGDNIIENKPREQIPNLDSLPFPARELINILDYTPAPEQYRVKPVTNIMGSRGCPFHCIYCSKITGNTIRFRSPQNIIEEIEMLIDKYGIKEIGLFDDTFTINKQRVLDFTRLLKDKGININWSAHARVNTVDKELLTAMANAGCWRIFYGIESMLQKNLDVLKKGIKVEQAVNAIKWTKEAGMESEASFMFGIPGETYDDALATIELIIELDPDYVKFFPITPMPGTELYENVQKYGRFVSEDFSNFTSNRVVFVPYTMSIEELEKLVPFAYKKFYIRPKYILNYIRKIRNIEDIKRAIRGAKAILSF